MDVNVVRPNNAYSLGASESEQARLDVQASSIAEPSALFMRCAGIAPGMRVLDLGSGLGHVAFQLANVVGATGAVVGIDQAPAMLTVAEQRRLDAAIDNVRFVEADVQTFRDAEPFDAVVGRLILFHLPDPVAVLRHHLNGLTEDGLMLMIDFDIGSVRAEPPLPLMNTARDWVIQAFGGAGAHPTIGTKLGLLLRDAGLSEVESFGVQSYIDPDDATAPALLSSVVRTLAPLIVASGVATQEELGLDSLRDRLSEEVRAHRAISLIPAVAGAWGRRRAPAR